MKYIKSITLIILLLLISCSSDDNETVQNNNEHNLIIKFKFDPNQERLDNFGNLSTIPEGNAAQSPIFERMSANYIEFAPNANTLLGQGEIIYEGLQTNLGGDTAIDFQNASFAGNNETFLTIPLSNVAAGSYSWVRTSLAYQEGNFDILVNGLQYTGTLGSFVGFNNYITTVDINGNSFVINENKLQGFGFLKLLVLRLKDRHLKVQQLFLIHCLILHLFHKVLVL